MVTLSLGDRNKEVPVWRWKEDFCFGVPKVVDECSKGGVLRAVEYIGRRLGRELLGSI